MQEKLAELAGAADGDVAPADGRHELAVANRTFLLIHRALIVYQDAAERRRQLAAEVGGELIASLVAAGWSEQNAREANIPNLTWAGG